MQRKAIDRSTLGGILVAAVGVVTGLWLDGGSMTQILQPTAALIVFGGTLGAVMVHFPMRTLREAASRLKQVFLEPVQPSQTLVEELLGYATKARRRGVVSLDADLESIDDPFTKRCLMFAVDGINRDKMREVLELDLAYEEEKDEAIASVFEAAGGFAPTVGIIGAVLGLIQVMQRLDNMSEVGRGIAVAFVATLYGVGSANLLFLPLAGKMRIRAREQQVVRELTLEAGVSIAEGISPTALKQRLTAYLKETPPAEPTSKRKAAIEMVAG